MSGLCSLALSFAVTDAVPFLLIMMLLHCVQGAIMGVCVASIYVYLFWI